MTSALLIGLVLAVAPSCRTTTVVMHPKFSSEVQYGFIDRQSWSPSFTTSVRGLENKGNSMVNLIINIEHLPDKSNFLMEMEIKCRPFDSAVEVLTRLPFRLDDITFCNKIFAFKFKVVHSKWQTGHQQPKYSLFLTIKRDLLNSLETETPKTFSHHVRIKFAFYNTQWRLDSNAIYLWSWESAFRLTRKHKMPGGNFEEHYFLSSDASRLLTLNLELGGAYSVQTIPFFDPELTSQLSAASQYVRSYANVLAIMAPGDYISCHGPWESSILFSIAKSPITEQKEFDEYDYHKMLKVAQVNENGTLTFSRDGLSKAMNRIFHSYNSNFHRKICVGLQLEQAGLSSFRMIWSDNILKKKWEVYGSPHDDCRILGASNRKVTLFARSGRSRLICPIICSNDEVPYQFYKGIQALATFEFDKLTIEDAGNYSCTAGNQTVELYVSVVSLPYFTMQLLNKRILNGTLPNKIYAIEGEGYSVKCTVYFSGVQTPMLVPVFILKSDGPGGNWSQYSFEDFRTEVNNSVTQDSRAELSESNATNSRTFHLTVRGVSKGKQRKSLFDHRLLCRAAATEADAAALYGLKDYSLESGSDVHFVQRLRTSSFETGVSDCCLKPSCKARTENCRVEIFLKKEIIDFLTNIGVKVEATFMQGSAPLHLPDASYDPTLAKVTIKAPGSLSSMLDLPRKDFLDIRPVFRYLHVTDPKNETSFTVLRGPETNATNDKVCHENSNCLFSTDFDHQLSERLTLSSIVPYQSSITSGTFPTTTTSGTFPTTATSGTFPKTKTSGTFPTTTTSKEDSGCLRAMPLTVVALALACASATFLFDGL